MSSLLEHYSDQFLVFLMVLTRIGALVMTAPIYAPRAVPLRIRALLAIAIAVLVTPTHWTATIAEPRNVVDLLIMLGREAVLGLALGLAVMILFTGLQLAGQIISQMSGMQIASVFDPGTNSSVPTIAQFLDLVAVAVFISMGGHRQVMGALLDTFEWLPPGQGGFSPDLVHALVDVTTQSFVIGIRIAAPVMVALLLAVLILGLISRTLPQLNILAVGFSFNSMVTLAMLAVSLSALGWVFEEHAEQAIQTIRMAMLQSAAT